MLSTRRRAMSFAAGLVDAGSSVPGDVSISVLLENRIAVVYGCGFVGGAVARAFARAGAKVFLPVARPPSPTK